MRWCSLQEIGLYLLVNVDSMSKYTTSLDFLESWSSSLVCLSVSDEGKKVFF